jgi:long-chain-fatty-acid--CoA ligase ACSBG
MWGTVTKIVPENGELCYSGRHIFMGYMYMPEQTAETIDREGFLHSGDVASFDSDNKIADTSRGLRMEGPSGFMRITGRIKELLITAGGENIPPVLIETEMKTEMLALANCIAIGDKRKYLTMLISLKCKMNLEVGLPTDNLDADALYVGAQIGSDAMTMSAAAKDPKWIEYINAGVKAANARNASAAQHIQKWAMLPADLSEKEGDLTPTLKLKRSVVVSKYADFISEKLYDGEKLTF